ncbi:hypothetical protein Save01_05863 [Streptomyces avermitilis]
MRSPTESRPRYVPAHSASSATAVPGSRTVSPIAWSASHGRLSVDSLPVNSRPPPAAGTSTAPSSGCSAGASPAAAMSPAPGTPRSQYRVPWKAYVGSGTRRPARPAKNAAQSTGTPAVCAWASRAVRVRTSGRLRRSAGATTAPAVPVSASVSSAMDASVSSAMEVSAASAPSSRNTVTPSASRARTTSWKRTGSRACRAQYAGSAHAAGSRRVPVTLETTGMAGGPNVSRAATCRSGSTTGSISGEWNAWLTGSRRVLRPRPVKCAATAVTTSSSPDTTTEPGPLTAATPATDSCPASRGSTSSQVAATETIAPPSGSSCINRPRAVTSSLASASDSMPETWAAVSSPTECPDSSRGRTPHSSRSRNRATPRAKVADWV